MTLQVVDVDAAGAQAGVDSSGMVRSSDQEGKSTLFETFADKAADDAAQGIRIVVELHAMKMPGPSAWPRWRLGSQVIGSLLSSIRAVGGDLLHDLRQGNLLEMQS